MIISQPADLHLNSGEKELWNYLCHFNAPAPKIELQNKSVSIFKDLLNLIRKENITLSVIPKVLQKPFDMRGQESAQGVISCLKSATFKKDQFILIDFIPQDRQDVERQFSGGFPVALKAFNEIDFKTPISLADLLKCHSYPDFKKKALTVCAQQKLNVDFYKIIHFFNMLDSADSRSAFLTASLKQHIILAAICMLSFRSADPAEQCKASDLIALVSLTGEIRKKGGLTLVEACLNKGNIQVFKVTPGLYIESLRHLNELLSKPDYKTVVKNILIANKSPEMFLESINKEYGHWYGTKYTEKNLETVKKHFLAVSNGLHPTVLNRLVNDYTVVSDYYSKIKTVPDTQLNELVHEYRDKVAVKSVRYEDRLHLIAVIRESIRRHFGILPHNTQIIAFMAAIHHTLYETSHAQLQFRQLLSDLKGHVPQVNTGEGKSTIVALQSAFFAINGRKIDIITSSDSLAIRDFNKYKAFYAGFDISSSHICVANPAQKEFSGQIVYGQNTDFEFAYLRQKLNLNQARFTELENGKPVERPYDIVIVDEIDNLLLDKGQNGAIMSLGQHTAGKTLLKPVFDIVSKAGAHSTDFDSLVEQLFIKAQAHEYPQATVDELNITSREVLESWFGSCHRALYSCTQNVDYVVGRSADESAQQASAKNNSRDQIIIVDKVTGKQETGTRWQNKLHEFLEIKHGLPVSDESYTGGEISHPVFFNFYRNIFGLTGTLGSEQERAELLETFKVGSFDVPPHLENKREYYKPIIMSDQLKQFEMIAHDINTMKQQGRPALVLTDTIKLSEELARFLSSKNIQHQVLNTLQDADEEYVLARAGLAGQVTIATNTASRGTDVDVMAGIKSVGGLHVVLSYYAENERVEVQGFGRGARQGAPGSCRLILAKDSLPFAVANMHKLNDDQLLKALNQMRQLNDFKRIAGRKMHLDQAWQRQAFLEKYYLGIESLNDKLDPEFFAALAEKPILNIRHARSLKTLDSFRSHSMDYKNNVYADLSHAQKLAFFNNQKQSLIQKAQTHWGQLYDTVSKGDDQDKALQSAADNFKTLFSEIFSNPEIYFETVCSLHFK